MHESSLFTSKPFIFLFLFLSGLELPDMRINLQPLEDDLTVKKIPWEGASGWTLDSFSFRNLLSVQELMPSPYKRNPFFMVEQPFIGFITEKKTLSCVSTADQFLCRHQEEALERSFQHVRMCLRKRKKTSS